MDDPEEFHAVFGSEPNLAYQEQTVHEILKHRRSLENELFFDRLLKAVGIDQASRLYPPRSNLDLQTLYQRIVSSTHPDHQQQSLVYYILKDLSQEKHKAETFAKSSFLPSKYQIFIDGLWYLDRLKLERALDYLTSPSLIPTFPDEILYTLCRHAPPHDPTLPLAYYHSVSPPLATSKVLFPLFARMCNASLTEAFYFSRSQGPSRHLQLLDQLIHSVLASQAGDARGNRALELIALPLSEEEETRFEEYLVEGKGHALPGARDTVMMRKVATGRVGEAVEFGRKMTGRKFDGVNWASLRDGLQQGGKPLA